MLALQDWEAGGTNDHRKRPRLFNYGRSLDPMAYGFLDPSNVKLKLKIK